MNSATVSEVRIKVAPNRSPPFVAPPPPLLLPPIVAPPLPPPPPLLLLLKNLNFAPFSSETKTLRRRCEEPSASATDSALQCRFSSSSRCCSSR
jgi:hypothetical protein